MANRYGNLVGSKRISEDFETINIGFDRVQAEMDTKGTPADAQSKADAAKVAAIAAAAADLAAHKERGADEHPTAKGNAAGFMSAADKLKSDASTSAATPDTLMQRDAEGRAKVAAPAAADDIARKAETDAVQSNLDSHTGDTVKHVTQAEHDKLNGIAAGAEVNQNAFAKVNDVVASDPSDTITFVEGTGIRVTTDPENKRISITATSEAIPGPHALSHIQGGADVIPDAVTGGLSGLMSGADAQYLRVGVPERFDEIEEYVADQIAAIPPVNDATQTEKGITMLSDATDGTRSNVAATEKAVGLAFQAGVERKAEVVAALNSIGVSASTSDSWDTLITKMSGVIRSTGTATVGQVLAGTTFSNATGNNRSGTMVNRGAVSQDITTQNGTYVVPQGYHGGSGIIRAVFANLIAANIRNGVNVGGVVGTLNEGIRYATGVTGFPNFPAQFRKVSSEIVNKYFLEVNGLAFKPKVILITMESGVDIDPGTGPYPHSSIYTERPVRRNNGSSYSGMSSVTTGKGDCFYVEGTYAFVTASGFRLPIDIHLTNINLTWYAFDI